MCASPLERANAVRVCLSAARHLCYTNDPKCLCRFDPQVWLARGSCGAHYSRLRRLNRPGIVSECGGATLRLPLRQHLRYGVEGGGGVDRAPAGPLQAESGVICPTANTTIHLSRAPSFCPPLRQAAALMHRRRRRAAEISGQQLAINTAGDWLTCERGGDQLTMSAVPGCRDWRRYFWFHCCSFTSRPLSSSV